MTEREPKERRPLGYKDGTVTVSRQRLRAYPHLFDWDEAKVRYEAGDSVAAIAKHFGVSWNAVKRVVDPTFNLRLREGQARRSRIGARSCKDCGAPISMNYSQPVIRCITCSHRHLSSTVRDTELRCWGCEQWKTDDSFPPDKRESFRRNRRRLCRSCETATRSERRRRARARGQT